MNADEAKAQAKKHAPTVGIVAAGVIAMRLMLPSTPPPSDHTIAPALGAGVGSAVAQPGKSESGVVTRLVSCGDSHAAHVDGDDKHGAITLGPGAHGKCTLLFAAQWTAQPTCMAVGAHIAKLTATDLVLEGAGELVTYDCGPVKAK